jgi:hypothetical protein
MYLPATIESYATPVPQTPLSLAPETSPAQRVPWLRNNKTKLHLVDFFRVFKKKKHYLLNQSSVYLG